MELNGSSDKLIYQQLADWLEDEILAGTFPEECQIPSVAELSANFKINHVTTLKSVALLTDVGIIYKKRGIGMFVAEGAMNRIREVRKKDFYKDFVLKASDEAKKLGISLEELTDMIERGYGDE